MYFSERLRAEAPFAMLSGIKKGLGLEKIMENPPVDYYYDMLGADLRGPHPDACLHLTDHLASLEAFLDKSICSASPSAIIMPRCASPKENVSWSQHRAERQLA